MYNPSLNDLKKIQGNVKSSNELTASVCGGAACNCTCGGGCNSPSLRQELKLQKRTL